jgi:hypothetical protein
MSIFFIVIIVFIFSSFNIYGDYILENMENGENM